MAVRTAPAHADPEEEDEQPDEMAAVVRSAPPWLVSGIIHMLLLIILGLWILVKPGENTISLDAQYAEELGEQLEEESFELAFDEPQFEEQILTPQDLPPVEDPFAAPDLSEILPNATNAMSTADAPAIGLALKGRQFGSKQQLLAKYGGNATTEAAVHRGLKWLERYQNKDGSWSLTGPYPDGGYDENREAATAMALLAFQGAGYTHEPHPKNPFSDTVARGWKWLLGRQDADGNFFQGGRAHHRLYTQAQCTIALCELFGMTDDKKFRDPALKAIEYCQRVQSDSGGWRYTPGTDSDTSVTGWFVMALQSAKMSYLPVKEEVLHKIMGFLDKVQADGGRRYGYQGPSTVRPAMTAEGLLCRQYLGSDESWTEGWKYDDERLHDGVELVAGNPPSWAVRNCYYWYYATQVCHHMGGDYWKRWNKVMRQLLPEKQVKKGAQSGSWDPGSDQWGPHGGRLMVTCLHIYMLEVYYRHLPIYQHSIQVSRLE